MGCEGLLGALRGDQPREPGVPELAVEELEASRRLDVADVQVGHMGDTGDRSLPPCRKRWEVARRRRVGLPQQLGADHVLLPRTSRDRPVRGERAGAQGVARAEGLAVGERH